MISTIFGLLPIHMDIRVPRHYIIMLIVCDAFQKCVTVEVYGVVIYEGKTYMSCAITHSKCNCIPDGGLQTQMFKMSILKINKSLSFSKNE